jgi:hypothetical protein
VGSTTGLNAVAKRKFPIIAPAGTSTPDVQAVAYFYDSLYIIIISFIRLAESYMHQHKIYCISLAVGLKTCSEIPLKFRHDGCELDSFKGDLYQVTYVSVSFLFVRSEIVSIISCILY